MNHLAVERGLAANTLAAYRRDLTRYTEFLTGRGITGLAEVTETDLTEFVVVLRDQPPHGYGLTASSTARTVVGVRGWHRFAHAEGDTPTDPSVDISPPATGQRLPKAISVDAVQRLLDAAGRGDPPMSLRNRALLELLYATGARISEIVGLDIDDLPADLGWAAQASLDTPGGTGADAMPVTVRLLGKGGKERVVPLGSYAVTALTAWLVRGRPVLAAKGKAGAAVFLNARGPGRARGRCCRAQPASPNWMPTCRRTLCGILLRHTCWKAAQTCGLCRNYWDMPT